MRVIYLHQYFNTPNMPGATRSYEFARRLVENGHEVHMVTTDRLPDRVDRDKKAGQWRISEECGIHVHWASVPYSNRMGFLARVRSFIKFAIVAARKSAALRGDVIFATSTPLTIAIPAIYASKRTKTPMVFEVRDLWPAVPIALGIIRNPLIKACARWLELIAYKSSSHIVALAPGMKEEIVRSGIPAERITVIPNGCDFELFSGNDRVAADLRKRHEWLGDRPLVCYVGALGRINAVDYLVEIARECFLLDKDIRFAVVGTGIEEENIRQLAKTQGVYEKNFFMMGVLPKRQAVQWVSASTMTIALVRGPRFIWKDATQNKYFDSLAAGKPVASNYDGWQAQVATEHGAGLILDPENYPKAAAALVRAVRDKEWLVRASAAALRLARERYSRDDHAAMLEGILERAAGVAPRD